MKDQVIEISPEVLVAVELAGIVRNNDEKEEINEIINLLEEKIEEFTTNGKSTRYLHKTLRACLIQKSAIENENLRTERNIQEILKRII